jgi:hypothetical protein
VSRYRAAPAAHAGHRCRCRSRQRALWYSVYLLYWYKSTDTDTAAAAAAGVLAPKQPLSDEHNASGSSCEFRCQYLYFCTSKASKLSACALSGDEHNASGSSCEFRYSFSCFTSTKVQILTAEVLRALRGFTPKSSHSLYYYKSTNADS